MLGGQFIRLREKQRVYVYFIIKYIRTASPKTASSKFCSFRSESRITHALVRGTRMFIQRAIVKNLTKNNGNHDN